MLCAKAEGESEWSPLKHSSLYNTKLKSHVHSQREFLSLSAISILYDFFTNTHSFFVLLHLL